MKVFLYETLEDASEVSETFSTATFGMWDSPTEIVSGDHSGQYWLAHKDSLEHYSRGDRFVPTGTGVYLSPVPSMPSGIIVDLDDELLGL